MDEEIEKKDVENMGEITRLLSDREAMNTIFTEPTNLLRDLTESFERKDYAGTLEKGGRVLAMMDEPTRKFVKLGMAFSISAASEWLLNLAEVGVDISKAEEIISEAKEHFTGGDYRKADENVGKVRGMIPDLEAEQVEAAKEGISSAERLIDGARSIGASIYSAERALQQAKNFLETENYLEVARFTKEAKDAAEGARKQRIQVISDALIFTRSIIDESRSIGVDTSETDALYGEAKSAFDRGDYQKCSEINKEAEEKALRLQDDHIKKVLALRSKMEKIMEDRGIVEEKPIAEEPSQIPPQMPSQMPSQAVSDYATAPTGYEPAEQPVVETPLEQTPEEEQPEEDTCPYCGSEMRYIEKYNRYWCNSCRKYGPKR